MLVGRAGERAAIDALLAKAKDGHGGALVLRGEPGIGKTALCDYAVSRAGMRVLRTTGAEGESAVGYAGLQRLVPELTPAIGSEPFAVAVKALTWISDAAPVLCVVDDAHWIDPASARALSFVARRIESEPVAMVFATRGEELADLPELRIGALAEDEARELLRAVHGQVQQRLLKDAAGNPLALVERSDGQIERAFARQVAERPAEERVTLLLVAAAGHAGQTVIHRAADVLGVTTESDLLRDGRFRHPLMRSAVYDSASDQQRQAVHKALAEAHDDPDERVWHRAKATTGPDEDVAQQLAESAERMATNGGYLAAAEALEQAAELGDEKQRGERLTQAAEAAWHGGDGCKTTQLLDAARVRTARSIYLRGALEVRSGVSVDAVQILLPGIAMATDPSLALRMLLLAREAAFNTASPDLLAQVEQVPVPKPNDRHEATIAKIFELFRTAFVDPALAYRSGAMRNRDECVALITELSHDLTDPELLQVAGGMAHAIGEAATSRALRLKAVAVARERAALGILATTLESIVDEEIFRGRFDAAEQAAEEGHRLGIEAGRRNSACVHQASLSLLAGLRGREFDTEQILAEATERQLVRAAVTALRGKGLAALAAGRFEDAVHALESSTGGKPVPGGPAAALSSTPDLVEAAVRAGDPARARPQFEPYRQWVESLDAPELAALLARCRALLNEDDPEPHFQEALARHAESGQVFEHARTRLLYGEFLRRARRRADAREPLRDALETFERLGTPVWAARAGAELRATGETVRSRSETTEELTPQERQIAEAAAAGATNREIAARLFLSPRTVDYHLRKVFRKLGISSRHELR